MGFSFIGLIIGILIILPSILFMVKFPPKNTPTNLKDVNILFTILEKVGQAGCLTVLVIFHDNFSGQQLNIWILLSILSILMYYGVWIRYVVKGQEYIWLGKPLYIIPIPLAIFPICAFGFTAIWGKSIMLGIATVILSIGHITISWNNYKQTK